MGVILRCPSAEPVLSIVEGLRINSATKNLSCAAPIEILRLHDVPAQNGSIPQNQNDRLGES